MPHRCAVLRGRKCTGRGGGEGGREGGGGGALCSLPRRDATANLRKRFPVLRDKRTTTTRRAGEEGLSGGGDRAIILPRPPPRPFPLCSQPSLSRSLLPRHPKPQTVNDSFRNYAIARNCRITNTPRIGACARSGSALPSLVRSLCDESMRDFCERIRVHGFVLCFALSVVKIIREKCRKGIERYSIFFFSDKTFLE